MLVPHQQWNLAIFWEELGCALGLLAKLKEIQEVK
jgi:hypothetical protein